MLKALVIKNGHRAVSKIKGDRQQKKITARQTATMPLEARNAVGPTIKGPGRAPRTPFTPSLERTGRTKKYLLRANTRT